MGARPVLAVLATLALAGAALLALRWHLGSSPADPGQGAGTDGIEAGAAAAEASLAPPLELESESRAEQLDERDAREPGPGVRARVLHRLTRVPLGGFDAELSFGGVVLGRDTSDARGRLLLPEAPESGAIVRVEAPEGWTVNDPHRWVAGEASGEPQELEFLAGPQGAERFRARLVDADTAEPIRDYMLRIGTREGRREQLLSDAEGQVESVTAFPEGPILVFGYDEYGPELDGEHRKTRDYFEIEHSVAAALERPYEIALRPGPTYLLELAGPPAALAEPLTASLLIQSGTAPPLLPAPGTTLVRAGSPPWVRFPASRRHMEHIGPVVLSVASRDGRWHGSTRVPGSVGTHAATVTLEPHGIVLVRVVDADGNGIPGARVQLHPDIGGVPRDARFAQDSAGNGLVEFLLVPPGRYLVGALAERHERRFLPLSVEGDARHELEIALPPARTDLVIAGRIRHAGGQAGVTARVALHRVRPEGALRHELLVPLEARGDEQLGTFEFRGLPAGDYVVEASTSDGSELEPPQFEVAAGTRGLEFLWLPPSEPLLFEIVARDAQDGTRLDPIWVWHSAGPDGEFAWQLEGLPHLLGLRSDAQAAARLRVVAPGYREARASLASARSSEDRSVLEVALERGWSGEVLALGPGLAPLAGVKVRLDGASAGETDAHGRIQFSRERAPTDLEFAYRGWIVEPSGWSDVAAMLAGRRTHARLLFTPQ